MEVRLRAVCQAQGWRPGAGLEVRVERRAELRVRRVVLLVRVEDELRQDEEGDDERLQRAVGRSLGERLLGQVLHFARHALRQAGERDERSVARQGG